MMKYFKYLAAFTVPLATFISLTHLGWWTWCAVLYTFGLVPFLDSLISGDTQNMTAVEEEIAKFDRVYDYLVYAMLPIQLGLLAYFLMTIGNPALSGFELTGRILSMGICCSVLGINVAHELGHRSKKSEQLMSKILLSTSLYMHFFIEHNRGHHKHVATAEDPASAAYGELVFTFWLRSVFGGFFSAWKLEAQRLKNKEQAFFSIHNEMIWYMMIQIALLTSIYLFFGTSTLLAFIAAAVIGFLLLESVNYIEHYGLRRQKNEHGVYERTLPIHSWNSNHPVGRLFLFELTRHSDHHFRASRKYQILRHFEEAPTMPAGYTAMILLALVPPLWFWVMHRHIKQLATTVNSKTQIPNSNV